MLLSCSPAPKTQAEVPPPPFTLDTLHFDARRDGVLRWRGEARHAEGDLAQMDVQDVTLVRPPSTKEGSELTLRAPTGQIDLDTMDATLELPVMTDPTGMTMTAQRAVYDDSEEQIHCTGGLTLVSGTLRMEAPAGVINLATGEATIAGPVQGTFRPGT